MDRFGKSSLGIILLGTILTIEILVGGGSLEASPVAYWKFDEAGGEMAEDSSGNKNNAAVYGASRTEGKIGTAVEFDGIDDYFDCGNNTAFNFKNNMSVEFWLRLAGLTGTYQMIASRGCAGGNENNWNISLTPSGNGIQFQTWPQGGESSVCSAGGILPEVWSHIVVTYESGTGKIYIDGKQKGINADMAQSLPLQGDRSIMLGSQIGKAYFYKGAIDDVAIYNRVLTDREITEGCEKGAKAGLSGDIKKDVSLVGLWHFDEGEGRVLKDSSSYGNDGEISGAEWVDGKAGKGLKFKGDGESGYVKIPCAEALVFKDGFTIESWIYPQGYGQSIAGGSGDSPFVLALLPDNRLKLTVDTVSGRHEVISFSSLKELDKWYYVAGTYDKSKGMIAVYLDGILENGVYIEQEEWETNNTPFFIGSTGEDQGAFKGIIDEVALYNRALTLGEVTEHYRRKQ